MARQKGTANLAASLEVLAGAPLDARTKVALKADLTASGTFPYPYEGMKVYVAEEHKYYTLIGSDPTVSANWQEDGSGGDPSTPTDFDDLTNRPTKNVTSMDNIITPLPSIRPRQFKYSTDEQVVGEWIDGKPVYQKTFTGTAIFSNYSYSFSVSSLQLDNIIKMDFICKNTNNNFIPTCPQIYIWYDSTNNNLVISLMQTPEAELYVNTNYRITLQYTKTTDTTD